MRSPPGVRESSRARPPRIPVTVIGGFLGAGKTTLLNHLLRESGLQRIAVLVNDFGALDVDGDLVAARGADTIRLANGCVCCSLADGLVAALARVMALEERPAWILIEASGVSLPWKIGEVGLADPELTLDAVLVVVDASRVRETAADRYVGDTVLAQLRRCDLVIVNKADLVGPEELLHIRDWLDEFAPGTPSVEAVGGAVPLAVLSGCAMAAPGADGALADPGTPPVAGEGEAVAWRASESRERGRVLHRVAELPDPHAGLFSTTTFSSGVPFVRARLEAVLRSLPPEVYRIKGFVALAETPGVLALVQAVGRRFEIGPAPDSPDRSANALVAIHRRGSGAGEALQAALTRALAGGSPVPPAVTGGAGSQR